MDERLIKQVVEAVLSELAANAAAEAPSSKREGLKRMLVVGDVAAVPCDLREIYNVLPIDDYVKTGNIMQYQMVLITGLTLTQLSDIAQGRDDSPEACCVIMALLNGIEVNILEEALPHNRFTGKYSRIYEVIENNSRALQTFGVKILKPFRCIPEPPPPKPARNQAPIEKVPVGNARVNPEQLITEDVARRLTASGESSVCLERNAIVTPLAWDYFRRNGISVKKGTGGC